MNVDINSNRSRSWPNVWNRVRYSIYAPFYDLIGGVFVRQRERSLTLLRIQPGERVLLIGAGTGLDFPFIPSSASITATDLTPAMVTLMKARASKLSLDADILEMDGQSLVFADQSFDCVILHLILAVVPDPYRCIHEAARVLKPGGRVAIFDKFLPEKESPSLLRRILNPLAKILFTDLNRRAGDILCTAPLDVVHSEPALAGGLFKILIAKRK
jgi:phosphatidylethanolamine/phosphatidyl-N-methylethanolamine N-methyltransferase